MRFVVQAMGINPETGEQFCGEIEAGYRGEFSDLLEAKDLYIHMGTIILNDSGAELKGLNFMGIRDNEVVEQKYIDV